MNRGQVVLLVTLAAVVGVGVVPAAAGIGGTNAAAADASTERRAMQDQGTPMLDPGTGGKANKGREDDESQQFPGNTSFRIDDHAPGATENSFNIFAVGFSENIRMHWNVVDQEDFRWDSCTSTDATAFGVDRGNDDPGTETDRSLLDAYKSVTYTADGIFVEFYKEEALAGSPVNITVEDEIVSRVTNCLENPDEPGWYRMTGYINGSTKMDATTDFTIYGAAKYVYICENCDSREDAVEKLGPPPTACPTTDEFAQDSKEWTCRTEDGEYYSNSNPPSGGESTPTESPAPGATETPTETAAGGSDTGTDTPTAAATPTPTEAAAAATDTPAATPTPTATEASGGSSGGGSGGGSSGSGSGGGDGGGDGGDDLSRTTTSAAGGGSGPGGSGGVARAGDGPLTPTAGAGPGLGIVAALVALVVGALLVRRRD